MKSAKEIYQTNIQFKEYLDKYLSNKDLTIEDALKKKIIIEIANSYEPKGCNFREGVSNGISTK